jgi:hypothetical protein
MKWFRIMHYCWYFEKLCTQQFLMLHTGYGLLLRAYLSSPHDTLGFLVAVTSLAIRALIAARHGSGDGVRLRVPGAQRWHYGVSVSHLLLIGSFADWFQAVLARWWLGDLLCGTAVVAALASRCVVEAASKQHC